MPSSDTPRTLAEGSQPERMAERAGRGEATAKLHLLDQVNSQTVFTPPGGALIGGPVIRDLPSSESIFSLVDVVGGYRGSPKARTTVENHEYPSRMPEPLRGKDASV